ncbi:MAG: c-type cytochrome [Pseudomonadota bacterium]
MSKSLNLFLPVFGFIALGLGVAYGVSTRHYKAEVAELAERQAARAAEQAESKAAQVLALEVEIEQVREAAREEVRQAALTGATMTEPAPAREGKFGLGRAAHPEEVASWDVDVLPDGRGLPEGSGDVWTGEEVFVDQCAACHGDFAEGVDNWPVLAGGFDTLADKDPVKTVGSYWQHLSTVWDYVNRSMPFGAAQTLSADETYAIVAYILYSNDLVDDDFVLTHENFAEVEMYNTDGFVIDDRPDLEYAQWRAEPCMENCKQSVEITMRATFLDVTPDDGGESVMNHGGTEDTPVFSAAATDADTAADAAAGGVDPELVAAGEKVFRRCSSCHAVGANARNKSGPQLNGLFGRTMGSVDGFGYSSVFKDALAAGRVWDEAVLAEFLADPKGYMAGTKMSFAGLKTDEDQSALAAYLKSFAE